jgi:hypothetical protein
MPTTTPNFGWSVPVSTDLVKDGATAIELLGDSIDASLVDLKGGTSGQVLTKNSNTDMDFVWVTDAGDISGVTAGTGISGGGTSGDVTITNSMATAIDAKGDLVAGTGADAFARLGVGTNGQVLTADSTAATGLAWATASSSSGPAFWVRRATSGQSVSSSTATKVQFNSEEFDTDSCYDASTNYRFTANKSGYYQFNAAVLLDGSFGAAEISFRKNGTTWALGNFIPPAIGYATPVTSNIIFLNGTTDYVEVFITTYSAGGTINATTGTNFNGVWIRS